jgi:ribosomal protein S15P/S13E
MVENRKKMIKYLKRKNLEAWYALAEKLGLRK